MTMGRLDTTSPAINTAAASESCSVASRTRGALPPATIAAP